MAPFVSVHVSAVKRTVVSWSGVLLDPSDHFVDFYYLWSFNIAFCTYVTYYCVLLSNIITLMHFVFCM